jgi:hypothetical protein
MTLLPVVVTQEDRFQLVALWGTGLLFDDLL